MERDFRPYWYSGGYCGVTVFSTAVSLESSAMFYMISLPIVDVVNSLGISTLLRHEMSTKRWVPFSFVRNV